MKISEKNSRLLFITSAVVFGTIGVFRRYIPLPSEFIAMSRGFIGAAALAVFMKLSGHKISWATVKKNLWILLVSGTMIGFNWILLFESYRYTSVATATLCYYMAPIIVILASPLVLGERLTAKKLLCAAAALAGMVLVSGVIGSDVASLADLRGVFLGLGAAALYACVVLINKKTGEIDAYDKTVMQLLTAAVVLVPYNLFTVEKSDLAFSSSSIILLLILGIIHTGAAYAVYFGSMKHLKAQAVALYSYIDPVVAIILSAVLLHESFTLPNVIGTVLILGSAIISETGGKMSERKKI